jgi:hypothetical protein
MSSRFLKEPSGSGFFFGEKIAYQNLRTSCSLMFWESKQASDPGFLKISKELTDLMKEPTKN